MEQNLQTEVVIIGGSYAGLSAAMALGRARRRVIVLDSGRPCNRQTPHSHNFLTQDGETPAAIRDRALAQVLAYPTVTLLAGEAVAAARHGRGFRISTAAGVRLEADKLLFATGVKDLLPAVPGFAESWGISVLHCPYCHGYEVGDQPLGVLGNGDLGFEFARLIHHWSPKLTLFTNGASTLSDEHTAHLQRRGIRIVENEIQGLEHTNGYVRQVGLAGAAPEPLTALFARVPFEQHCTLPQDLGCALAPSGHLQVDEMQRTTVPGIYAAGDATTPMRAVAAAVAAGTKAAAMLNHELIGEQF